MGSAAEAPGVEVSALVVCREVRAGADGTLDLLGVLEVIALERLPGDAGPLTFVALARGLPPGRTACAFVLAPLGQEAPAALRLPLEADVPQGVAMRQVALQIRVTSLPVQQGGWYEVAFAWEGRTLARTRFAVGTQAGAAGGEAPRVSPSG